MHTIYSQQLRNVYSVNNYINKSLLQPLLMLGLLITVKARICK